MVSVFDEHHNKERHGRHRKQRRQRFNRAATIQLFGGKNNCFYRSFFRRTHSFLFRRGKMEGIGSRNCPSGELSGRSSRNRCQKQRCSNQTTKTSFQFVLPRLLLLSVFLTLTFPPNMAERLSGNYRSFLILVLLNHEIQRFQN